MFHNTIDLEGERLEEAHAKTNSQEDYLLGYMRRIYPEGLTSCGAARLDRFSQSPITSARRALTNLMNAGLIEKTSEKVEEEYGMPNYLYRFIEKPVRRFQPSLGEW